MLQLPTYSKNVCDEYVNKVLPGLIKRIIDGRQYNHTTYHFENEAKSILLPQWNTEHPDDSVLRLLLTAEPKEHFQHSEDIWLELQRLSPLSRPEKKTVEIIFNYDGAFNSNTGKKNAYWLAKIIGRNTCTYCNRQYIFTIEKENGHGEIQRMARPVFDYWFAKSEYPLLSLNLYNLIPSCTVCNSSVKGTITMGLDTHVHPYMKEPEVSDFTFRVTKKVSEKAEWELKIDRETGSKMDRTIKDMALEEVYSLHVPLEVKDIMDFYESYPEGYVNTLLDDLLKNNRNGLSRTEVYRILFGVEADSDRFLDRPFSKLKSDLLKQIGLKI